MTAKLKDTGKGDLNEIPRRQRRAASKPLEWYVQNIEDTGEGMARAYETGDYTMKEIGEVFGVHYSTVSRAISRIDGMRYCKT